MDVPCEYEYDEQGRLIRVTTFPGETPPEYYAYGDVSGQKGSPASQRADQATEFDGAD